MKRTASTVGPMLLLPALLSCSIFEPNRFEDRQRDLDLNRETWQSRAVTQYGYRLQITCFCSMDIVQPVFVEVDDNAITGVQLVETGEELTQSQFKFFYTIEGLFGAVQNAIDEGADSLATIYDAQLGYPTSILIDFSRGLADDELGLDASELEILGG